MANVAPTPERYDSRALPSPAPQSAPEPSEVDSGSKSSPVNLKRKIAVPTSQRLKRRKRLKPEEEIDLIIAEADRVLDEELMNEVEDFQQREDEVMGEDGDRMREDGDRMEEDGDRMREGGDPMGKDGDPMGEDGDRMEDEEEVGMEDVIEAPGVREDHFPQFNDVFGVDYQAPEVASGEYGEQVQSTDLDVEMEQVNEENPENLDENVDQGVDLGYPDDSDSEFDRWVSGEVEYQPNPAPVPPPQTQEDIPGYHPLIDPELEEYTKHLLRDM